MAHDHKAFEAFCRDKGNDVAVEFLEELADLTWSQKTKNDRITISSTHQHNACNHTHSGTVVIDGAEYGFVIESGDWNGTVVREWGPADDVGAYDPPPKTIFTFVPTNGTLKEDSTGMWKGYLAWRKMPWFQDKERGYNYDRYFAPGGKTEGYYREWATKKGLRIVSQEEADEIINRPVRNLIPLSDLLPT